MRKILRRGIATLTAITLFGSIATVSPITNLTTSAENIIKNSTFDSGTSGWTSYYESGGSCTLSTEFGMLALCVKNVGTLNYSVQVYYSPLTLYEGGVYCLQYDIASTIDRPVEVCVQKNGGDYETYCWKTVNATSDMQHFEQTFTMTSETDQIAKLAFSCGTQGEDLAEHTIYLDNVSLDLVDDSGVSYDTESETEPSIVVNQVGYRDNAKKTAVLRNLPDETERAYCHVIDAETGNIVYSGYTGAGQQNSSAAETDFVFDFSAVTSEGTYFVTCDACADVSYSFSISRDPNHALLEDTVRMYYLQRCGTEIEDETFSHDACHTGLATVYGTEEQIDVSGGWHDAGDYGRYVVAGAKAIADLILAYEENPTDFGDNSNIPESGNGIPDILDEVRYELEWMLKMQAESGGVYHKVTCANFPGYVMPEEETDELICTPISTTATADFAAVMAMAYETYTPIDTGFAEICLAAAERAWQFLEENPSFLYTNPDDITTGDYGDTSDKDERYWAAAQLYRATGEEVYRTALESMNVQTGLDWQSVGDYGNIAILTMDEIDTEATIYTRARSSVISRANSFRNISQSSPYGVATSGYYWGSNMTIANAGVLLALAYQLEDDSTYLSAASAQLDYLLGENAVATCFVTGYGTVSPETPHHRPSMVKETAMPGMLVGGVNSSLDDIAAQAYLADAPRAKCYIDNPESYSTNEITIYWNSPLVRLISMMDFNDTSFATGDVTCDGSVDTADITALQAYLLGTAELSRNAWYNADISGDKSVNGNDLSALRQALQAPSILDYGTSIDATADLVADFRKGTSSAFSASNGWSNGAPFNCIWRSTNATISDNALCLTIDTDSGGSDTYSGAEYRTTDFYGYGYYETSMMPISNSGVVSSFFTYTGPSDGNAWDEIDIEFLGNDTTRVQLNYYTDGVGGHEVLIDLGFDAARGYHTYGFDWQADAITWYIDGVACYTATDNIPSTPGRIMMNVWNGIGVDDWIDAYDGTVPLTARYQWVTYRAI